MPRLNARWIGLFAASAAVLITLVSVVGYESYKEGTKMKSRFNAFGVELDGPNAGTTNWTAEYALEMDVTVDSFDPNKSGNMLGFHINYFPLNNLTTDSVDADLYVPSVPVRVLLDYLTVNFNANTVMPVQTVSQILDGDINRYPFDTYTYSYEIYAFTSPGNGSYGMPLPLTVFAQGGIQGFKVDTSFDELEDDGSGVVITFTLSRSPITKVFSILIIIVMWCLSSGIFIAAMSVWFRERKVDLPLIAISTALLFALPNVRNSQPGIPPVAGTTSDMVGFFWNLLLVASSAFSLIINFVIKSRRDPVKPTVPAEPPAKA
ncbi:hypothetical protein K438DRAFT_1988919 [Mycena galopus ATCC 62051]|nr:hypothetical protein K438DRAFT_1988919 [Mycena galopus ATCC 62051]